MHRYSPVRNPRTKGIKIKHVLRVCFLISVCCWLIFQIKRSHYNRNDDLESVDSDSKLLSRKNSVDEVVKLGRKDVRPKEIVTREEEEDDEEEREVEVEEEKDDEIDENEQYKFDDEEEMVNETANEAREEHYKADDASSAVTDENEDQTLDTSKFLEHDSQVHNRAKVQETGSVSANVSSGHNRYGSNSTRAVEESEEALLKSTNASAVVEPLTMLTAKEAETEEEPDEVQHDAIDSTDVIGLEELDNSEDTVAE